MKLSARARYAVRILLDLAVHEEETPVSTVVLSERTGITLPFVEQLLKPLKRSGTVSMPAIVSATPDFPELHTPSGVRMIRAVRVQTMIVWYPF